MNQMMEGHSDSMYKRNRMSIRMVGGPPTIPEFASNYKNRGTQTPRQMSPSGVLLQSPTHILFLPHPQSEARIPSE